MLSWTLRLDQPAGGCRPTPSPRVRTISFGDSKISGAPAPRQNAERRINLHARTRRRDQLTEDSRQPRPHRITVSLTAPELAELRTLAGRDRTSISAVLRMAARDAGDMPPEKRNPAGWDEGYDHALQQELSLLNLVASEQVIKLLENMAPYGQVSADESLAEAAQAAQRRIARGSQPISTAGRRPTVEIERREPTGGLSPSGRLRAQDVPPDRRGASVRLGAWRDGGSRHRAPGRDAARRPQPKGAGDLPTAAGGAHGRHGT